MKRIADLLRSLADRIDPRPDFPPMLTDKVDAEFAPLPPFDANAERVSSPTTKRRRKLASVPKGRR